MAVSTFCRECGEHFAISAQTRCTGKKNESCHSTTTINHTSGGLAGGLLKLFGKRHPSGDAAFPLARPEKRESHGLTDLVRSVASKTGGLVAVRCFDCDRVHKVPHNATSTICPSCSSYISLEDIVVTEQQTREIRTRGNVTVKKGVTLIGGIHCNNLKVYGKVLGTLDCSGELHFHTSGRSLGAVSARKLVIHRRCEVTFVHDVTGEVVEIEGTAFGTLTCNGRLHIGKKGSFVGDVATRSVAVDSGGTLSGQLRIINDRPAVLPDVKVDSVKTPAAVEANSTASQIQEEATDAVPA